MAQIRTTPFTVPHHRDISILPYTLHLSSQKFLAPPYFLILITLLDLLLPFCTPLEGVPALRLKVWERGRENGSFPVEEGLGNREVSQEQIPICDGGGLYSLPRWRGWHGVPGVDCIFLSIYKPHSPNNLKIIIHSKFILLHEYLFKISNIISLIK